MTFTFTDCNKNYIIKKIRGKEDVVVFLKRLGIVEGNNIKNISCNGSGFIVLINDETRIALDKSLANKIMVEEYA